MNKSKEEQDAEVDEILRDIERLSRKPFVDVLSNIIAAKPSLDELRVWAKKTPDRWAQSAAIFARCAGYTEKTEITNNFNILTIEKSSDAELWRNLIVLAKSLGLDLKTITQQCIDVTPNAEKEKP
jgi:hypothetical protein